jgi:hypothetical protein
LHREIIAKRIGKESGIFDIILKRFALVARKASCFANVDSFPKAKAFSNANSYNLFNSSTLSSKNISKLNLVKI